MARSFRNATALNSFLAGAMNPLLPDADDTMRWVAVMGATEPGASTPRAAKLPATDEL
jgi:hypothetical protein